MQLAGGKEKCEKKGKYNCNSVPGCELTKGTKRNPEPQCVPIWCGKYNSDKTKCEHIPGCKFVDNNCKDMCYDQKNGEDCNKQFGCEWSGSACTKEQK